ncbi:protein LKAAEAR1 isoform X1 [Patella vulgata]|uniref:protein LKAAEAR1 isoform X1 n=2 Tax=Patella vulgata TaxID=6465 RepID=UPI0021805633|nr:protein LKAAEAR1 isoform X1 [Patella vulgata]
MADTRDDDVETYKPKNMKKLTVQELKKLTPQERSRYLAYEEPSKNIQEVQLKCKKRLIELHNEQKIMNAPPKPEELLEKEKHAKLIGQLKAAEARNRLRIMRLRYQANRAQEISHLIACQPSALKAVRLQALVPPYSDAKSKKDDMDKLDIERVEILLEDAKGLITNRIN